MKTLQMFLVLATTVVVIVVTAGAIFYFVNAAESQFHPIAAYAVEPGAAAVKQSDLMQPGPLGDMALGNPKAPNVVIEYASLTCPHCQRFNAEVFKPFKAKYIDTGTIYYIFRDFPLDPVATSAAMLARCAPRDRFFPIIDLLFRKQKDWAYGNDPKTALFNLVRQVGFTQDSFNACLANQKILDGVNAEKDRAASKFSVDATPTFFVNGRKEVGEQTLADFAKRLTG